MGKEAAEKIKKEADKEQKDLDEAEKKAAEEKDAEKKRKMQAANEVTANYIAGLREAQAAATEAPPHKESAGIRTILTQEETAVDDDEKSKKAAEARRDGAEVARLSRKIDLETSRIAGKRKALDIIF
jgi:hypothetical protein